MTNPAPQAAGTVSYPGPATPAVPAFRMAGPSDWIVSDAPGVLALLSYAHVSDGFTPNIAVTASRVGSDVDLNRAADAAATGLAARAISVTLRGGRQTTVAGCTAIERVFDFAVQGMPFWLVQRSLVFLVPSGSSHTRFVFQIQGSCLSHQEQWFEPVISGALQSFELTPSTT